MTEKQLLEEALQNSIDDEDESFLPPVVKHDYRPKYTGVRRPITFVKELSPEHSAPFVKSVGSAYLSLVLPTSSEPPQLDPASLCPVCKLPLLSETGDSKKTIHDTSIAHQVCLEHKHPPSHIDRSRVGFKFINSQGWDPDERKGLGKTGEGIRFPVIPKEKKDKLGIGARPKSKPTESELVVKQKPLNAKQVRQQEAENKKKKQKLERMFHSNGELEKYLGEDI